MAALTLYVTSSYIFVLPSPARVIVSILYSSSGGSSASSSLFERSLNTHFPGARRNSIIGTKLARYLKNNRKYSSSNTLLGSSICVDEINEMSGSLITLLENQLLARHSEHQGIFHLGGLGGLPFVGKTGMAAFVQHCPDKEGKLVIVFGPHVGISESGEVGKIKRTGMERETTSCGAAMAAYQALSQQSNNSYHDNTDIMDFQEDYIVQELGRKLGALAASEKNGGNSNVALVTIKMYQMIWELLKENLDATVSKPNFWESVKEITLLGGIIINRSALFGEDHFQLKALITITQDGETNLTEEIRSLH